ncbi:putative HTH-type transcriptional regulator YbbH [Vibrio thalassae]|uniref:Putative HTH-type transcriptional regulator YbbH n=1 Tax=Vibrio thalassae TaxID=1243014 RepID=A0A240ENC6_9VIBR|nr:MurR/RpiR family transcriptional regulator [Vibrio thalassae]SNX49505.1 putative HTH-type transcriptional regulator YbbH [Vibrio thalassae]
MKPAATLIELQQQIRLEFSGLSKRLQQVAAYVLDNPNDIALETVATIGQKAEVPPSTLIRFASAFGFSGFNEMKKLFREKIIEETSSYTDRAKIHRQLHSESYSPKSPKRIVQEFANANSQAMNSLANHISERDLINSIDILKKCENIYVIGLRRSFSVASYFTYTLRHLNKRAFLVDGLGGMLEEQMRMIGPNDAVIAISFSPYANETVVLCELAAKVGAKQIMITDSQVCPLANFSDISFIIKEAKVDAFRSQSTSLCLVQSIAVAMAMNNEEQ